MKLVWQYLIAVTLGAAAGSYLGLNADNRSTKDFTPAESQRTQDQAPLEIASPDHNKLVAPPTPIDYKSVGQGYRSRSDTVQSWVSPNESIGVNLSNWANWARTQGGLFTAFSMKALHQYLKNLPPQDLNQVVLAINENASTEVGAALYTGALLANALPRTKEGGALTEAGAVTTEDRLDLGAAPPMVKAECSVCDYTSGVYAISPFMAENMVTTAATILEKCKILDKADYYFLQDQTQLTRAYVLAGMFYSSVRNELSTVTGLSRVCQRFDKVYFSQNPSVSDAFWESKE